MNHYPFVGREYELNQLNRLLSKKSASLVVIKGRRRIGKSRLVEEFAKNKTFYRFSGLPPTQHTTAQAQRDEFSYQLNQQTGLPQIKADDWNQLFGLLAERVKQDPCVVLFDEITWMGMHDPDFLGKLKNCWDLYLQKNSQLILILCGSVSGWIQKNLISSTGFLGRISLTLTLEPLSLMSCNQLLNAIGFKHSSLEKFMLLAVMGGIPWYLEQVNPSVAAAENIQQLCFTKDGLLVAEFERIFHDLFGKRGEICKKIVNYLASGPAEYNRIAHEVEYASGGPLTEYLNELVISGFVQRDFTWSIKTNKLSKLSHYRLSDNYLRFYLKYISPKLANIQKSQYLSVNLSTLPQWQACMGLQFENLVIQNRILLHKVLNIKAEDIVQENPYFQRQTTKQSGCQIDYLIQTKYNTLYVCEIKFSKNSIKTQIIEEMKTKINNLAISKGYSCLPVLIHINGVSDEVIDQDYFYKTIDFSEFL